MKKILLQVSAIIAFSGLFSLTIIYYRTFKTAGVTKMILTGTSLQTSQQNLTLAQQWIDETQSTNNNLYCTVGIHPHHANTFDNDTLSKMRELLSYCRQNESVLAVSVGECGLDYNRNFSTKEDQRHAFREQVKLAVDIQKPLFVHEREAHKDLIAIFDEFDSDTLPPIVIHCFTGSREEAMEYVKRGYYIGFTGTICKKERGAHLRELMPSIPLERIMVETDAPFMGFVRGRSRSEPVDCLEVARKISEVMGVPLSTVCDVTTGTACKFFGLLNKM